MGEVFRARDARLKRDVALKVLPAAAVADADRRARFEREAQVLAALDHPNIAAVFGVEDVDGAPVIVTSPGFRDEICPQGDCLALGFNPAPALNDDGNDAEAMTDFMRMLAPPQPGPSDDLTTRGETLFHASGCAACHRPALQTGPSDIRALDRVVFRPYSDFLLHDMGALGDGIAQASAGGQDMRTAPLWGLRLLTRFLHDGSATTIEDAVRRHDGQGRASSLRFEALTAAEREALLAFLRSL